jgi:type IV secretion system protein VirB8
MEKQMTKTINPSQKKELYFEQACSWADDRFGSIEASRNRFRIAFISSMTLCTALTLAITAMMPLKQLEPIIIHQYANGVTTAERLMQDLPLPTQAQIESDLVRYAIQRESYDVTSYRAQFELIHLLSSNTVGADYDKAQRSSNKDSPLNQLGTQVSRSVHVYSVNFIDQERFNEKEQKGKKRNHNDLAEVVFSTLDKNKNTGTEAEHHFTALVSWHYTGIPASPEARWNNWNGFEVTRYSIQQRNVK